MFKATARTLMKTFKQFMDEDAPVNNVGGGAIAGAVGGETPPVFNKKKNPPILARGLMPGARKRWSKK